MRRRILSCSLAPDGPAEIHATGAGCAEVGFCLRLVNRHRADQQHVLNSAKDWIWSLCHGATILQSNHFIASLRPRISDCKEAFRQEGTNVPGSPLRGREYTVKRLPVPGCHSPHVAVSVCIPGNARSSELTRGQAKTESVQVLPPPSGRVARKCGVGHAERDS